VMAGRDKISSPEVIDHPWYRMGRESFVVDWSCVPCRALMMTASWLCSADWAIPDTVHHSAA